MTQKDVFLAGEGDAWYRRNRAHLAVASAIRELPPRLFAPYLAPGDAVLEIGCADGSNLAWLCERTGAHGFGVDPSAQAIADGRARFPHLDLRQGTADALPFADAGFKLVWFAFCLYLLDRNDLMRAMAEADRVLGDGGLMAITDFDPPLPCRRPYHHRPGIHSWKMDYSRLLLANPAYVLVAKTSYSHAGVDFHPDPNERIATWLMRKSIAQGYIPQETSP
jgi:ubiquinone/menaquinone biosynthesis C-methylase UbiE